MKELEIGGEPLPRLEDVLGWARDAGACLSLDMKTFFRAEGSLVKEVIRLLERTNMKENVLLLFFDHRELFQTKSFHPELIVRALLTGRLVNNAGYLQSINADCVSVSYGIFRPEEIESFHSAGIAIALAEYWDQGCEYFQRYDIDMLSCGSPLEARRILNCQ